MKGNFAAIVLIVIGAVILLRNLGMLNFNFVEVIGVWWPAVLIALGIGLFLMPRDTSSSSDKR
jgi:Domain of unknown function (DUF5668)